MAETIHYIEYDGTDHTLTGGDNKYISGDNLMEFESLAVIDSMPAKINLYRGSTLANRAASLRFRIKAASYQAVQTAVRTFLNYFTTDLDQETEGTVRVIVDAGGTYDLSCIPTTSKVERLWTKGAFVRVNFEAANRFWNYLPAESAAGTFAGTTPVSVAFSNGGDVESWPTHVITGVVDTPRIAYPNGNYVEVGTVTANADDELHIYCKPGDLRVDYVEHGSGTPDPDWTCYAGTASQFDPMPTGAGTITLTATSGTALYAATWPVWRSGIG